MIAIQILLILAVIVVMVVFLHQTSRTRALSIIAAVIFAILAIAAILFPETTTWLAQLVGIGRGTDLVLYCLVVFVMFTSIQNSVRRRQDQQRLAKVVRQMALLQAPPPPVQPAENVENVDTTPDVN